MTRRAGEPTPAQFIEQPFLSIGLAGIRIGGSLGIAQFLIDHLTGAGWTQNTASQIYSAIWIETL